MSEKEYWLLGRKDARNNDHNPPPLFPEFGGHKDLGRCAYDRGWLGLRFSW